MENIQTFVNFCAAYGVPKTGQFQTVDLYDGRNMTQVISCIQQLGSEASTSFNLHGRSRPSGHGLTTFSATKIYFSILCLLKS